VVEAGQGGVGGLAPRAGGPSPIRAILFDKDGTLFDFQATWGPWTRGMIEAESRGDPAVAAALAEVLGYDLATGRFRPDAVVVAATTATVADTMLPLLPWTTREDLIARMEARAAGLVQVEAAPLGEVLARLAAMGLVLGVATNDSEAPARVHLAHVAGHFAFVAGYDSGWGGKPAPGQLLAFAAAVDIAPEACAMVGDSLHDLAAARAAGMLRVGVLTGMAGRDTLEPAADVVLGSIAELPDWIAQHTAATDRVADRSSGALAAD
jgi:phosphoglycolate phosphatase